MSDDTVHDPAVEAAKRAIGDRHWWMTRLDDSEIDKLSEYGVAAAREALAPIRDLHRPFDRPIRWGSGVTEQVCNHCHGPVPWPCTTAVHVYREDELR